jgi:hypothetical protein
MTNPPCTSFDIMGSQLIPLSVETSRCQSVGLHMTWCVGRVLYVALKHTRITPPHYQGCFISES